ncbi:MAG: pirin family protein [Flavobacteriaceae bacterium]|nr:pirin family protein [Flavobacteriaceae bacterium]
MKIIKYKAEDRGYANYDWLQANYSFSFANYYNPGKSNFGALRVLNDDVIQGGMGFGEHPHDNMEIITIPLQGALKHKDSMTEKWIPLETGEVQVMSAGKGIMHAERNNSTTNFINLFQIWIIPEELEVEPTYNQMKFESKERDNKLQTLVTSFKNKDSKSLKIHQDAIISRIDLSENSEFTYELKSNDHGVYLMLISGEIIMNDMVLNRRDAIGISETTVFTLIANLKSEILFIEVPMAF